MEIELKHVTPYYPYELVYQYDDKLYKMSAIIGDLTIGYDDNQDSWHSLVNCKPILRPLSDLTKEIEIDGKKFIPEFIFDVDNSNIDSSVYLNNETSRIYFEEFHTKYRKHHLDFMPYGMIQQLFKWHFDVFGLIDKGLAIDINTLD